MQGIYAKYFGLSLASIASVLLIARLFDAISDPMIGFLSDRFYARSGSRKQFVVCGGVLLILACYFLYVPPVDVSSVYFLGWFLAFYFAFTMFEIPHLAWASDLVSDSQGKNTIYGWRAVCLILGSLTFFAVPLLPIFETNEFTPETLKWSVLVAACLVVPGLIFCVRYVPDGGNVSIAGAQKETLHKRQGISEVVSGIVDNPPLLWFLCAFFFAGAGAGLWLTLLFLFVDSFLGMGDHLAWMYIVSFGSAALSVAGWTWLANTWGKQSAWGVAMITIALGIIGSGMLSPETADIAVLTLFSAFVYSGFAAWIVLAPSLLADIVDFGAWKLGSDRAGTSFSLYTLVSKANFSIGGALGLAIVGYYGFDATTTVQSVGAEFGLRVAMVWMPVPMVLLSILFMAMVRIDTRRHAIIRRRLDSRAERALTKNKQFSKKSSQAMASSRGEACTLL